MRDVLRLNPSALDHAIIAVDLIGWALVRRVRLAA